MVGATALHTAVCVWAVWCVVIGGCAARWATTPANTQVAPDAHSLDQLVPLPAVGADGVLWTAFYNLDGGAGQYVMQAQVLDAAGDVATGSAKGLTLSGRKQDAVLWGFDAIGVGGGLAMVFSDLRHHEPEAPQYADVVAYRMGADLKSEPWGRHGMALSRSDDFEPQPRIVQRADGAEEFVVVWPHYQRDGDEHTCIRAQRLGADGSMAWAFGGKCVYASGSTEPGLFSLVAAESASGSPIFVLAFVRDVRRHHNHSLEIGAFDWATGDAVWATPVLTLYGVNPLQLGYLPQLAVASPNLFVVAWCTSTPSNTFETRWQAVDALGKVLLPHGGASVSTNDGFSYLDPRIAIDRTRGIVYVAYTTMTHDQRERGLGLSAFNLTAGGAVVDAGPWSPSGWLVVPVNDAIVIWPTIAHYASDSLLVGFAVGEGESITHLLRIDAAASAHAAVVWDTVVSDVASRKTRFSLLASPRGNAIMTWADARHGPWAIFAASVLPDGSLGAPTTLG